MTTRTKAARISTRWTSEPSAASRAWTGLVLAAALAIPPTMQAEPLPGAPEPPAELAQRLESIRGDAGRATAPRTRHLESDGRPRYVNRLALEQSPYLLQHAHNPVDWHPWGDDAFAEAERRGVPVLLSVGYSTCHWCHVMEEESFEDLEIAAFLNQHFVPVKVDREERPDVDSVYMTAVQALTGHGGWPMTVFLTPAREPFFGGTYFPPRPTPGRGGMGFLQLLERLDRVYRDDRESVVGASEQLVRQIRDALMPPPSVGMPGPDAIHRALDHYARAFDPDHAGLRGPRKFPASLPLPLLMRAHRRTGDARLLEMTRQTLDAMRRGGIRDHLAGGFHRYTVDPSWTVPHFEKMLYDNAQLTMAYLEGWQVTGDETYAATARDVLAYVRREMTAPSGAFYSATDADSEGEEGRYFVWRRDEVERTVGEDLAALAAAAFGLDAQPNFEHGTHVLRRDLAPEALAKRLGIGVDQVVSGLAEIRKRLLAVRSRRIPPLRDDKQLVSWNGLMIQAFARAGLSLREPDLLRSGSAAATALLEHARPGGRLARYLMNHTPYGVGLLDDHVFLEAACLDLFEASGEARWLDEALWLQGELDRRFFDAEAGGYFVTPHDGERLLAREKSVQDDALPSGNAVAVENLLRLAHLTSDSRHAVQAEMTLRSFADLIGRAPTASGRLLAALDLMLDTPKEILIVTPDDSSTAEPFLRELGTTYLPNRVLVVTTEGDLSELKAKIPLLEEKRAKGGRATAYVCENRVCDLPTDDPAVFAAQIRRPALPYSP